LRFTILKLAVLLASAALLLNAQENLDPWSVEHFQAAKAAQTRGELEIAAEEYRLIVARNPRFGGAYLNLGIVYQLQNKYPEAIHALREALTAQPELAGAKVLLGISYYMIQEFAAALRVLDEVLAANPRERQAGVYRALALLGLDRPEEAAEQIRNTAEYYPGDTELAYHLGAAYSEGVRQSAALLLADSRDSSLYHWAMGLSAEQKNDFSSAIVEYIKALARDPQNSQIYTRLAALFEKEGFAELSRDAASRLARDGRPLVPANSGTVPPEKKSYVELWEKLGPVRPAPRVPHIADSAINDLIRHQAENDRTGGVRDAIAQYDRGDFEAALERLKQVRYRGPSAWVLDYFRARCYVEQGSLDAAEAILETSLKTRLRLPSVAILKLEVQSRLALRCYEAVLSKQPDSNRARILRAKAFAAANKIDEAVEEYRTVLRAQPDLPEVHLGLAQIYSDQLHWPAVIEELKQELRFSPDNGLALALLGHAYAETDEAEQAIPILLKVVAKHPGDASAQADLGKAYARKGETQRAIESYERAVAGDESQYRLHYRLYRLYQSMGQQDLARRHLAAYHAKDSQHKARTAALR